MKRVLIIIGLLALAAPAAHAGEAAGCGLGSTLFTGQSGLVPNILAATTNGISGNQTFGMTSGTSGCDANSTVQNDARQQEFVAVNFEKLSEEMAQGRGAYVAALAELMGCEASAHARFAEVSQAGYERLFPSADADGSVLLTGLKREIGNDAVLSSRCTRIS